MSGGGVNRFLFLSRGIQLRPLKNQEMIVAPACEYIKNEKHLRGCPMEIYRRYLIHVFVGEKSEVLPKLWGKT